MNACNEIRTNCAALDGASVTLLSASLGLWKSLVQRKIPVRWMAAFQPGCLRFSAARLVLKFKSSSSSPKIRSQYLYSLIRQPRKSFCHRQIQARYALARELHIMEIGFQWSSTGERQKWD